MCVLIIKHGKINKYHIHLFDVCQNWNKKNINKLLWNKHFENWVICFTLISFYCLLVVVCVFILRIVLVNSTYWIWILFWNKNICLRNNLLLDEFNFATEYGILTILLVAIDVRLRQITNKTRVANKTYRITDGDTIKTELETLLKKFKM